MRVGRAMARVVVAVAVVVVAAVVVVVAVVAPLLLCLILGPFRLARHRAAIVFVAPADCSNATNGMGPKSAPVRSH